MENVQKSGDEMVDNAVWITWEYQVRNRNLSNALKVPLVEFDFDDYHRIVRYFFCTLATIKLLLVRKPRIVIHQSPSIFLAMLIAMLRPIFKYKVVMDVHNAGVRPAEGKYKILNWLARFSLKRADLVIFHNNIVASSVPDVQRNRVIVLADPLPAADLRSGSSVHSTHEKFKVLFICRWAEDEPYEEVLKAASVLAKGDYKIEITCTGKVPSKVLSQSMPVNVCLAGFVSNTEYSALLNSTHCVLALTTRKDSLNCAAYEGMAHEKPTILSNSPLLKRFFGMGYLYTDNNASDIVTNILVARDDFERLSQHIRAKKKMYQESYSKEINNLECSISSLMSKVDNRE